MSLFTCNPCILGSLGVSTRKISLKNKLHTHFHLNMILLENIFLLEKLLLSRSQFKWVFLLISYLLRKMH